MLDATRRDSSKMLVKALNIWEMRESHLMNSWLDRRPLFLSVGDLRDLLGQLCKRDSANHVE